jgi:hypothetical protein
MRNEESGLSSLEIAGLIAFVLSLLALITPIREAFFNLVGTVFGQTDPETGHVNDFSEAARGIAITVGAVVTFVGAGWFLLWTNLGKRLAFLLTGAATFGWLVINGALFVVYAPRGIRPADLEGLNAFQMRLPAVALTLASLVLLIMFLLALTRYEADVED